MSRARHQSLVIIAHDTPSRFSVLIIRSLRQTVKDSEVGEDGGVEGFDEPEKSFNQGRGSEVRVAFDHAQGMVISGAALSLSWSC